MTVDLSSLFGKGWLRRMPLRISWSSTDDKEEELLLLLLLLVEEDKKDLVLCSVSNIAISLFRVTSSSADASPTAASVKWW